MMTLTSQKNIIYQLSYTKEEMNLGDDAHSS